MAGNDRQPVVTAVPGAVKMGAAETSTLSQAYPSAGATSTTVWRIEDCEECQAAGQQPLPTYVNEGTTVRLSNARRGWEMDAHA